MDPNLCLIGGCGSSGTTLLAHLLDGIGDLRCSPEAYVFHHANLYRAEDFKRELYRALAQQGAKVVFRRDGLEHCLVHPIFIAARDFLGLKTIYDEYDLFTSVDSMGTLAQYLKGRMETRHGFPHHFLWVDQTPKNVLTAALFLESLPGARFIHIIRDGRDVVASLAKRYAHESPGRSRENYVTIGALRWCHDVSWGMKARGLTGYLEVRYEDLTTQPLKWINVMLRHLDREEIDADRFQSKRSYAAEHFPFEFLGGPKPSWDASPTGPVTTRSVGKWRKELSPEDLSLLEAVEFEGLGDVGTLHFRELLAQLNYG
jgi:hypothetical protein